MRPDDQLDANPPKGDKTKHNEKTFLFLALALMPLLASAQSLKFAYFSYNEVLQSMADYATAVQNMKDLRAKYDAETQRSEKISTPSMRIFLKSNATSHRLS